MKSYIEILFETLQFSITVWHEEENKEIKIPLNWYSDFYQRFKWIFLTNLWRYFKNSLVFIMLMITLNSIFLSFETVIMKKTNVFLLAFLAIACVIMAVLVVLWTKKVDKMMDAELNPVVVEPVQEEIEESEVPVNNDAIDALQESFDSLLSGDSIEELYEWETEFGFIGNVE